MYFFCSILFIFSLAVSSDSYKSIEVSEVKENLSNEIFKKLSREHYVKNFDKTDFNENYINAVFKRLDEDKKYFIQNEVDLFIKESKYETNNFDIALAYKIINLYFERLIDFSSFQIDLLENYNFDFDREEFLDIYTDDNIWQEDLSQLKALWRLETKNDLLVSMLSDSVSEDPKIDIIKRYKNRIRRITPYEAMLIQGFKKNTAKRILKTGLSDTHLYKLAGNAVSPLVVKEVLRHILD